VNLMLNLSTTKFVVLFLDWGTTVCYDRGPIVLMKNYKKDFSNSNLSDNCSQDQDLITNLVYSWHQIFTAYFKTDLIFKA